jgi:hypothetical protein
MRVLAPDSEVSDEIIAEVIALTEHAVPLRYDEILDTEPIDRDATVALVESRICGKAPERSLCSLSREAGQTAGVSFWGNPHFHLKPRARSSARQRPRALSARVG